MLPVEQSGPCDNLRKAIAISVMAITSTKAVYWQAGLIGTLGSPGKIKVELIVLADIFNGLVEFVSLLLAAGEMRKPSKGAWYSRPRARAANARCECAER